MTSTWSYARISRDDEKQGKGVRYQHGQNSDIATRTGWPAVGVEVTDNDVTAADVNVKRPGYRRVIAGIRSGECSRLIIYKQDRGVRLPGDLEDLIDLCAVSGVEIMTSQGPIDLRTSAGRLMARVNTAFAMSEVERVRERVSDKLNANAKDGLPPGGPPGYGYDAGYVVNQAEASVIRDAADRVLAGNSMREIVRDLNASGIPSKNGGRWERSALKYVLTAPRIAGLRKHQGKVVGSATWKPIIDISTHEALVAYFASNGTWKCPGRYPLTGFLTCFYCNDLTMGHHVMRNPELNQYACKGCRRIGINARKLEKYIAYTIAEFLDGDHLTTVLTEQDGAVEASALMDRITALEAELIELATMKGAGDITLQEWLPLKKGTEARIAQAKDALAIIHSDSVLTEWVGEGSRLTATWDTMTTDGKRRVIEGAFKSIRICPSKGGPRFDASRVEIVWAV